jgi:hypothetical protein
MRKFSTEDDEEFRNRTLRFTNNNFVGNNIKNKDSNLGLEGWETSNNKN